MPKPHLARATLAVALATTLTACAGADALTNHADLGVHTHMSETVFLDPVPESAKTVYIGICNTSDYPSLDVRIPLMQAIIARPTL